MPSNPLTALTSLAVTVFRFLEAQPAQQFPLRMGDGIYDAIQQSSLLSLQFHNTLKPVIPIVFPEPDFSPILVKEGDRTPMLLTLNGGARISPEAILSGMLTSAWIQLFLFGSPNDETAFVKTVLQNYAELRNAMLGEKVRTYYVTGISGISLSPTRRASTPWGLLLPAPRVKDPYTPFVFNRPTTTCTLVEERMSSVKFDLSAQPEYEFDGNEEPRNPKAAFLFTLACVLSLAHAGRPGGPIVTWSTSFLPFLGVHGGSFPGRLQNVPECRSIDESVHELESWSKAVEANHSEDTEIAATRLVSSVVHRENYVDSLIDAVMVWENLLGTSLEVSFRVTAALAKLLESDVAKRRDFRKKLARVYDVRSRIIHGAVIDPVKINDARNLAVDVAIRALREFYRRGDKWMSMKSTERADTLLLSE